MENEENVGNDINVENVKNAIDIEFAYSAMIYIERQKARKMSQL